jgi:lysozyme
MTLSLDQWIIQKEGLKLKPYADTRGFITIGFGHNLSANGISINIATQLLNGDIAAANNAVTHDLPWVLQLDAPRRAAIVHLCFWIGIGSLLGFTKMLAACQAGDWQAASQELLDSNLHDTIPERTEEIATRLLTGGQP